MQTSPLRAQHARAGALLAPAHAPTAVVTFGDVPAEYAAAREGALLLDATERGLVALPGADTEGFLHRLLANRVKGLVDGTGNHNLLLSAKGKVQHTFDLARLAADHFEASTPPGDAPGLIASLDRYLFSEDTAPRDATEEHAPLELVGPRAAAIVEAVLGASAVPPAGTDPTLHPFLTLAATPFGAVRVTRLPIAGAPGLRLAAPPQHCAALWAALTAAGARPGGLVAFDALRAEHVVGAFGQDITEDVYPQEARLEAAFALDKGCYIGQEVVAKIDTYGGLNKRLFLLRVDHDEPVAAGTRLIVNEGAEQRDLGVVTTWAYSFREDGGVVLAYVKRKHQDPGRVFELVGPGGAVGRATLRDA